MNIFVSVLNCEKMRKKRKQQEKLFIVRTRCFYSMSAHGGTFRVLIVANVVLHFHVLLKFFFCFPLSYFLYRKILYMHFLSQTFFSHFRIHVSFSELQHFHTLFNFGLRFVKNQMKLKLHCFPSDIFIIIIKERKAMRLE